MKLYGLFVAGLLIALFGVSTLLAAAILSFASPIPTPVPTQVGNFQALFDWVEDGSWKLQTIKTYPNGTIEIKYSGDHVILVDENGIVWIDNCAVLEFENVTYLGWKTSHLVRMPQENYEATWVFTGLFWKLDYSYQIWAFSTEPSMVETNGVITVSGQHGNDTWFGFDNYHTPEKVYVTFFNGTNTAYTTYYWKLGYWTDPVITEELQ